MKFRLPLFLGVLLTSLALACAALPSPAFLALSAPSPAINKGSAASTEASNLVSVAAGTATPTKVSSATRTPTARPTVTATRRPTATPTKASSATRTPTAAPTGSILLLAGDICKHDKGGTDFSANCKKTGDLIRSVLAANPGAQVQTLGDNVNNEPSGSYDAQYTDLYAPAWGSFLNVTHAMMGNHDYLPPSGTAPYYNYFGTHSGGKPGYYSYNIGASWHIIVLNAECAQAGGCSATSPQTTWLKNDLAANTRKCILAAWHQPRWTSGRWPDNSTYASWWNLLYQYKADIVANGHNHNYERFNLITPSEQAAPDGIREFIVGTGGSPMDTYSYAAHPLDPNEAIRSQVVAYGVLKLTLNDGSYIWKFMPAAGSTFTDSGTQACH